jgi:predicted dehydrogenase
MIGKTISKDVNIGLVGAGFMGRCHANAFRAVGGLFDLPVNPVMEMLADIDQDTADKNAAALGFARSTGDWRELVCDPAINIVAITAPNVVHEPIALAAIENGKAVYCEKPLSTTSQSARRMCEAAKAASTLTMVGFNFLQNPMIGLAHTIIDNGEIGEVVSFRGRHAENYMVSPNIPHSFRTDVEGGGAMADIGSHILSLARYLIGPITEVCGVSRTIHAQRPVQSGSAEYSPVEVDDVTHALVRFDNGCSGNVEANWAATGRTMDLSFEITGTRGAVAFSQERMNELLIWKSDRAGRTGFTRIESGPDHPPYGNFCPAPGHHLGFNDLKVIEVARLLGAYANGGKCYPDFEEALAVQETVEAIANSVKSGTWVTV